MGAGEEKRRNCNRNGCHCSQKCLLSVLTSDELLSWQEMLVPRRFMKGNTVFWEDEEAEGLYLVCSGVAKLLKSTDNGNQQIVRLVGPGNFFGLPPIVGQKTHFCTCQALEPIQLQFISRQHFLHFLEQFPQFAIRLIDELAEELRLARLRLRDFSCKNGRQRMADLLLWLGNEFGKITENGIEIAVGLARSDLAGIAGLTTETTIRILSSFRQVGAIGTGETKRIVLYDQERLKAISGSDQLSDQGIAWPD